MDNIHFRKNTLDKKALESFFVKNKNCFSPNLDKVVKISEFCEKIINNAEIFEAWSNGDLAGVVCMYANDKTKSKSFITMVLTASDYRNKKIGSALLDMALNYAKENGFLKTELEVAPKNNIAIKLYQSKGFKFKKFVMENVRYTTGGGGKLPYLQPSLRRAYAA